MMTDAELVKYYEDRRAIGVTLGTIKKHFEERAELIERIQFELTDFNEDSSGGDPRYEIHAENMARLLEQVLEARGAAVPEVPEWSE